MLAIYSYKLKEHKINLSFPWHWLWEIQTITKFCKKVFFYWFLGCCVRFLEMIEIVVNDLPQRKFPPSLSARLIWLNKQLSFRWSFELNLGIWYSFFFCHTLSKNLHDSIKLLLSNSIVKPCAGYHAPPEEPRVQVADQRGDRGDLGCEHVPGRPNGSRLPHSGGLVGWVVALCVS